MKKMPKTWMMAFIGVVLTLAGASYFVISTSQTDNGVRLEKLRIVSQEGSKHKFKVEIAATPIEKEMGLMFREKMAPNRGMLFQLGQTAVIRFWMKNTLIPLDMVFIATDGTIQKIHYSAEPLSLKGISSDVPVKAVLELNGGRARALGITAGDKVIHPYFRRQDADKAD